MNSDFRPSMLPVLKIIGGIVIAVASLIIYWQAVSEPRKDLDHVFQLTVSDPQRSDSDSVTISVSVG